MPVSAGGPVCNRASAPLLYSLAALRANGIDVVQRSRRRVAASLDTQNRERG
jgi:hypothetical protein